MKIIPDQTTLFNSDGDVVEGIEITDSEWDEIGEDWAKSRICELNPSIYDFCWKLKYKNKFSQYLRELISLAGER